MINEIDDPSSSSCGIARVRGGGVEGWAYDPLKTEMVLLEADGEQIGKFFASEYLNLPVVPFRARRAAFKVPIIATVNALTPPPNASSFVLRLASSGVVIAELAADEVVAATLDALKLEGLLSGTVSLSSRSYAVPPSLALVVDGALRIPFHVDIPHRPSPGFYTAPFYVRLPSARLERAMVDVALVVDDGEGDTLLARRVFKTTRTVLEASLPTDLSRLLIVDPSLTQTKGHMLGVCEKLVGAARSKGIDTKVVANKKLTLKSVRGAPIYRLFAASPYDEVAARGVGGAIRDASSFQPIFDEGMQSLASDHDLTDTMIVYPTVNHVMAFALAHWLGEREFQPGEHHAIYFMLESGLAHGEPSFVTGLLQEALHRLSDHQDQHVSLSVASRRLHTDLQKISAAPLYQAPSIVGFDSPSAREKTLSSTERLVVGLYFGEVKSDKGFFLTPGVLAELASLKERFSFFIQFQDSNNTERATYCLREIERLRDEEGVDVTVLKGYIAAGSYERIMRKLDILVTAYDPVRYAAKTSGLVWESLSLRLPVVVPEESWAADECKAAQLPHATFSRHDPRQIADAVRRLEKDLVENRATTANEAVSAGGSNAIAFTFGGRRVLQFLIDRRLAAVRQVQARLVGAAFFEDRARAGIRTVVREASLAADAPELIAGWGPLQRDHHGAKLRRLDGVGVVALYIDRSRPLEIEMRLRFSAEEDAVNQPRLLLSVNDVEVEPTVTCYNDLWVELRYEAPRLAEFAPTVLALSVGAADDRSKLVLFENLVAKQVFEMTTASELCEAVR